jgi:hypothetical protein
VIWHSGLTSHSHLGKGQEWNIEIWIDESESQYSKPNPFRDGVLKGGVKRREKLIY